MSTKNIYMDYSASTPVAPEVLAKMLPYFGEHYGNPSSQHRAGWQAMRAVDQSRLSVAKLLNAKLSKEIIFTSGASEANSLALFGYLQFLRKKDPHRQLHALTSQVEHKSVLETFYQLKDLNVDIDFLPVNGYGQVEPETLKKYLRSSTVLMSFMWGNNEVGSINPMEDISQIAKENNICLHSDATQACGKIEIDLQKTPIDLLSLSGHKMYGPKGVGALYLRHQGHHAAIDLWPMIRGGGQEYNLRAGTLNVPGIVGLGEAATLAKTSLETSHNALKDLTDQLLERLRSLYPALILNGHPTERLPGHLHLTFPGIRWDQWLPRLSQLCVSTTSACSSESGQGSHVLQALGFSLDQTRSSLRISLGKFTTPDELDQALALFQRVFNKP